MHSQRGGGGDCDEIARGGLSQSEDRPTGGLVASSSGAENQFSVEGDSICLQLTVSSVKQPTSAGSAKMDLKPRSFGDEITCRSNLASLDAGVVATVESKDTVTTADETVLEGAEDPEDEESPAAVEAPGKSDSKPSDKRMSASYAPIRGDAPTNRRGSLPSSYRRPGNVVNTKKLTTIASTSVGHRPVPRTPFRSHSHLTPVRISAKVDDSDVQATNDGYASVAKLSAWLADDPTKAKHRVKQIRRGANVIAKSRKFDKELANVKIIEADALCRGRVREKQQRLMEQQQQQQHVLDDDMSTSAASHRTASSHGLEVSSAVSVQAKKEWLTNVFGHKAGATVSKTDVGTQQDEVDDVTARAKQLWRLRTTPPRSQKNLEAASGAPRVPSFHKPLSSSGSVKTDSVAMEARAKQPSGQDSVSGTSWSISSVEFVPVPPSLDVELSAAGDGDDVISLMSVDHLTLEPQTPLTSTTAKCEPVETIQEKPSPAQSARFAELQKIRSRGVVRNTADAFVKKDPEPEPTEDLDDAADKPVNFQAARDLLISRSKKNGNAVEVVSKVSRRKAMFEKLQKDNQRKSLPHGHLKPSWKPEESGNGIGRNYKKTFLPDIVPRKSFEELP